MAQKEVEMCLFKKRLGLSNAFYTATEIAKETKLDCANVIRYLRYMESVGMIERNMRGAWQKAYRLSDSAFIKLQKGLAIYEIVA